jgi:hypothetical protein
LRSALLWTVTQRVVVIPYRRFGTTYRPTIFHLDPSRWDWKVVLKRRWAITTTRRVIAQMSAVLIYFGAEAWNNAPNFSFGKPFRKKVLKKRRRTGGSELVLNKSSRYGLYVSKRSGRFGEDIYLAPLPAIELRLYGQPSHNTYCVIMLLFPCL